MPSRIDEARHTKALVTQSRSTGGKAEMFSSAGGTRTDNTSVRVERGNDDDEISFLLEETGLPGVNHRPTTCVSRDTLHVLR